jgi:GTP cyclohydrolase I
MTNAMQIQSGFLQLESTLVVFKDIRAVNMTVCWHHLLFQFSNFEFPNLVIYLDAAN